MTTRPRLGRTGLAVALLLAAAPQPAARASLPEPVRILLVGDSVTQGSSGDWTWRYRLWQHLVADGVGVDLVGPSDDLYDNVTGQRGSHEYVDPAFDQDHAARWGMQFATQDVPVADLVAEYHPDVVVEGLGLNDLAWRHVGSTSSTRFVTPPIRATSRRTAFRVRAVHQFLLGGLSDVVRIRLGPS